MGNDGAGKEQIQTAPPPFDPEEYARESESMMEKASATVSMKPTMPPDPSFAELRESCSDRMQAAEPVPDSVDYQSEVRVLSSAPLNRDLPSLDAVPFVAMQHEDLEWFELDALARDVLALVDGCNPVGAVLTKSPLGPDETCQLLRELLTLGIIDLR